jgi:hypothetical protein
MFKTMIKMIMVMIMMIHEEEEALESARPKEFLRKGTLRKRVADKAAEMRQKYGHRPGDDMTATLWPLRDHRPSDTSVLSLHVQDVC